MKISYLDPPPEVPRKVEDRRSEGVQQLSGLCSEVGPGTNFTRFLISRPQLWIWQQYSVAFDRDEN